MTTLEYAGQKITVEEVDQVGGSLNETMDFDDILYRDRRGRYFLQQK